MFACLLVFKLGSNKGLHANLAVMALASFNLDSTSLILEHECRPCNIFLSVFVFISAIVEEHGLIALESVLIGLSAFSHVIQVARFGNNTTWVRLLPPIAPCQHPCGI